MAENDSALQHAVFVTRRPGLRGHDFKRGERDRRVVGRGGIPRGEIGRGVFEIGQVNIADAAETVDRVDGFVTGGVPDDGAAQPVLICEVYRFDDAVGEMRRRHEVDAVGALRLQAEHRFRERGGGVFLADLAA